MCCLFSPPRGLPMSQSNIPSPIAPMGVEAIREWLEYVAAALIHRRDEVILPALTATHDRMPNIPDGDSESAEHITDTAKLGKALIAAGEEMRKVQKEPFLVGGREVDAFFRRFAAPLTQALFPVEQSLTAYHKRRLTVEREAREAVMREAEEKARAAAEKAAQAMVREDPMVGGAALDDAILAQ